jgi:hypothetical protein
MKKNWPMLVVLGLAGTACDSLLDPTVFHGAVDPECAGKLEGTPLAVQTPGDCVVQVCDGHGHARVDLSPEDVADDGNPCTKDECKNQEAVHATLNGSMAAEQVVGDCLVKQCNAEGVVVEVPDDTDTGETLECRAVSCENGVKVATNAQSGASCEGGASECNSDGLCVNWCNGDVGFPGEALQYIGPHDYGAATGDIDNDGLLDLVFADYNGSTFRVMRGLGSGKFDTPVVYVSGLWATSVALADLDGKDGLDVVISEAFQGNTNNPGGVRVYFNNGGGNFIGGVQYATGGYARDVAAADMNGDGKPDLAVANYHGGNVSVLLNQGDGTFAPAVNYPLSNGPISVIAADLDGDSDVDLAVANRNLGGVSVLLNNFKITGEPTFAPSIYFGTGIYMASIHAADLNGDTKLDLVVTTLNSEAVGVMMNQGGAVFSSPIKYPTGKNAIGATTADLNGDTFLDIAASNYDDGTVSTLLGNGKGTFEKATNYAMGNLPTEVVAADFTGDGAPDLVAANGTGYLRMLVNKDDSTGTFHVDAPHYDTGTRPTSIAAQDFNGDNVPDLAVTNFYDNTVSILQNEGNGKLESVAKYDVPGWPSTIVSDDFNNDGMFDLAVSESARGYVAVLINQGNSVFKPAVEYASGAENADAVVSADVNGDSLPDLLVAHRNGPGGGTLGVLLNQGNGVFAAPVKIPVGDQGAFTKRATLGVADLNDDNKPDIVVGRVDSTFMHLLLNDGNGSFVYADSFDTSAGIGYFAIADLNSDSWRDVVVSHTRIMKNSGGPNPTFTILGYHTLDAGTVAIADLNGDGKPDMVNANPVRAELNVFMNDGKGVFPSALANHYAAGVHESYNGSIVASDLNVDGRPDLAVIDDDGVSVYLSACL